MSNRSARIACALVLLIVSGSFALVSPPATGDDKPETGGYAGAQACAGCHVKEYAAWATSSHAHSVQEANADTLPTIAVKGGEVVHPPGRTRFRPFDGGVHAETLGPDGAMERYHLSHVVGQMRIQMFLARMADGRLQVLPGMREVPTSAWFDYTHLIFGAGGTDWSTAPVVKPGDPSFWTGAVRSFDARCARCHVSGYAAARPDANGKGPRSTWRALGIDCESCHGPGGAHAAAWKRLDPGAPLERLETLPRGSANRICLPCHMEAEPVTTRIDPSRDLYESLDPTLLLDPERVDAAGRVLELIYEGLSLATSRCAERGALRCADCHDPHGSGQPGSLRRPITEQRLCMRCHEGIAADVEAHTHHAADGPGARCVACHMPPLRVERGHGLVHDHTIGIPHRNLRGDRLAENACDTCHAAPRTAGGKAPLLAAAALDAAYARWWPDAREPALWIQAIGAARATDADGTGWLLPVIEDEASPRVARASAVRLLGRTPEAHREALLGLAGDEDSLIRRSALTALAGLRGRDVDRALREALQDPSLAVRRAAARAAVESWERVRRNTPLLAAVIPVLEEVATATPESDTAWFQLAAARDVQRDAAGALAAYRRMVELQPLAKAVRDRIRRLAEDDDE